MKKLLFFGFVSLLSLGLVAPNSHASGTMGRGFKMFDSSNLIGATVRDSHGQFMGVVNEVMADSGGHAFAIVNYYDLYYTGGVNSLVPLRELRISQTKGPQEIAFLKTDMEHGIKGYWIQSRTPGGNRFMNLTSLDLVGTAVENSCGKVIGIVNEVMVDSGGDAFAIVNHGDYDLYGSGGVNTPVPLQELRISRTKGGQEIAFLKTDMEHLDFAPYLNPMKKENRQYWANIYEYYGFQPYWTENDGLSK